jgi:hypothetical protein
MAKDKNERIPRKLGKGSGSSARAKPGSEDPINNIFRDRNDGLEDSEDENTDYNFRMDRGPTAGTIDTTANSGDAAGTTTGTTSTTVGGTATTTLTAPPA